MAGWRGAQLCGKRKRLKSASVAQAAVLEQAARTGGLGPRLFVVDWEQTRFGPISVHHSEFIIHLSSFTLHNSLRPCEYSLPTAITEVQTMANPEHLKILEQGVAAWYGHRF